MPNCTDRWCNTRISQKFCNILATCVSYGWFCRVYEVDKSYCTVRYRTHVILSEWYLPDFLYGLGIDGFRPIWACQILELVVNGATFLELSGSVINCAFTFRLTIIFDYSRTLWPSSFTWSSYYRIRRRYTFIYVAFKSHTVWSNAQCLCATTNIIIPTIASTLHDFNCFIHVIFVSQNNT